MKESPMFSGVTVLENCDVVNGQEVATFSWPPNPLDVVFPDNYQIEKVSISEDRKKALIYWRSES